MKMNILKPFCFVLVVFLWIPISVALAGVDLNTASQSELEALPGVGEKLAKEIIGARPFKSVEELKAVKGIGDAKFNKLKGLVSAGTSAPTKPAEAPTAGIAKPVPKGAFEKAPSSRSAISRLAAGEKINLNTASKEDLIRLPGIGEKKAQLIIDGRPYKNIEDIKKIKGIKEGIFNKIQNNITVN